MKFLFTIIYHAINFKAGRTILPALFIAILSILLFSCDPRGTDEMYRGGTFQIKAKVLNPIDSLNLGDSLKVIFEIPDTVFLKGFPYDINAPSEQIILIDKSYCEMGEELGVADSTRPGGITNPIFNNSAQIYANPGTISGNNVLRLIKFGNKFMATYYLIPIRKGVFYIASGGLGGYFEGNSTSGKIKCRIVFDFDVQNKHHYLLQPAIGVNNNLTPMINERASHGQGLYVFAVK